jgi:hypothetical protein
MFSRSVQQYVATTTGDTVRRQMGNTNCRVTHAERVAREKRHMELSRDSLRATRLSMRESPSASAVCGAG